MTRKTHRTTTPTPVALDEATLDRAHGGAWYAKLEGVDGFAKFADGSVKPAPATLAIKPLV